jgi:branched-chain amino acid transport system permease protein
MQTREFKTASREWASWVPLAKKLFLAAILIFLITLPYYLGENYVMIFLLIVLYMSFGQMWNLLAGYAGLVSLGQQIFIGIGGYSLAVITEVYRLNIYFGILVGGIVSAIFALMISQPLFKMKGVYFTIGSWIVAETLALFFVNWEFVRYGMGFNIKATYQMSTNFLYYLSAIIGVGSVVLVQIVMKTKWGLAMMAMRDNEVAAEVIGVDLYRTKLAIFVISSFVTGITGAVMYLNLSFIQPNAAFGIDWTVAAVFIVIIGGIGTMEGPIVGAIIYVILKRFLYDFPGISMIILGLIAIVIIMVAPRGIIGTLHDKYGFEILSPRRN